MAFFILNIKKGLAMELYIALLIIFPFLAAAVQAFVKNNTLRKVTVYISSATIIVATVVFVILNFGKEQSFIPTDFTLGGFDIIGTVNYGMLAIEFILMGIIIYLSFKYKKYYAALLSVVQTCFVAW